MGDTPTDPDVPADGSFAGRHPEFTKPPLLVGPATADEKNAVRPDLTPVACWRLDDIRFDFDSSFVSANAKPDLQGLNVLLKKHTKSPISIFGHADPVGTDAYNKALSGRRALAVYAILTRNADAWETLYSDPNEKWGSPQVLAMLTALGYPPADDDGLKNGTPSDSLKAFQGANGLTAHGYSNASTRKKLYLAYMDALCGPSFRLAKSDFLGRGADPDGRGDYQGCSEFNPLMLFSQAELDNFSKPENYPQRNAANAQNRRVIIFIFAKNAKISTDLWPCPKAVTTQFSACEKRFWSDGRTRLKNTDKRRTYAKDHDTFACRFYDRLATGSPCENPAEQWVLRILVAGKDPLEGRKPLANEPYTLTGNGSGAKITGRTDAKGVLRAAVDDDVCNMTLTIAGMEIPVEGGALHPPNEDAGWKERLSNLGFGDGDPASWTDDTYANLLTAFQKLEKMEQTGVADDVTTKRIKELHGS